MKDMKKHCTKKWEVSIMEIRDEEGVKFKVTRRLHEMRIAETKIFKDEAQAR